MKVLAVDIAGMQDWTALVGVAVLPGVVPRQYRVPYLDRWHAKYLDTAGRIAAVANLPEWATAVLAIDATGVGRPVLEAVRSGLSGRVVYGITFTAGSNASAGPGAYDFRVPKKDLVGAAQLLFQQRRIKVNPELPHAEILTRELVSYTVKITPHANETFEVGREAPNDDLVCALAMAAWLGEREPRGGDDYGYDLAALNWKPPL